MRNNNMTEQERQDWIVRADAMRAAFVGELDDLLARYRVTLTAEDTRVGFNSSFECEYLSDDEYYSPWDDGNENE